MVQLIVIQDVMIQWLVYRDGIGMSETLSDDTVIDGIY
jgi:hypothetical protein